MQRLSSYIKSNLKSFLLAFILISGLASGGWLLNRADQQLRTELLSQARLQFQTIDSVAVNALTGTAADLGSPVYKNIKHQLITTRVLNPEYHFLVLVGQKPDGTLFTFTDSEPVTSPDYAPPGQVRSENSAEILRVIEQRTATVNGPHSDHRGVWVSAWLPLLDPLTGKVSAVAGLDTAIVDWVWKLAAATSRPVGLDPGADDLRDHSLRSHSQGQSVLQVHPDPTASAVERHVGAARAWGAGRVLAATTARVG